MRAGGFTAGTALIGGVRPDRRTAHVLDDFRARRKSDTNEAVIAAAERLDRPEARRHPLCAEFRQIVDAELAERHLSLADLVDLAGGAR